MPNRFRSLIAVIPPYSPSEPLFESQRLELHSLPTALPVLGGGTVADPGKSDLGLFEPEKDEFKTLASGLKFLKLTSVEAEDLYKLIGSGIKIATSIITVVGVVTTVADLAKKLGLLGPAEVSADERLKAIGERLQQIYSYLAGRDRKGLYVEAINWRAMTTVSRQTRWSTQVSRSEHNLTHLTARMGDLDVEIAKMVEPENGEIAFQRLAYGYVPGTQHWIDAAKAPFVGFADGAAMPEYNNPAEELQTVIWDAGHYIDELASSLRERVLASAAAEPAFRSTGEYRVFFRETEAALGKFIQRWRGAFLVANPAACIGQDGELRNPLYGAEEGPSGILVGASDPVTGISSLRVWGDFPIKYITSQSWGMAYGGLPQRSVAIDPVAALAAGTAEHARLVDQVVKASGIDRLRKLQNQYAGLAHPVLESEFVRLPLAKFKFFHDGLLDVVSGEATTVDLGELKKYASDPAKTYPATRYYRQMEKTFRFRMARRTEISRVQLGYRLQIEDVDIELCPYSRRPAEGFPSVPFPIGPIERTLSLTLRIADCCQTSHFSAAKEDSFEKEGGAPDRVFVPHGPGAAEIQVSITFVPLADGRDDAHAGEAVVTIRCLRPREVRDAFELKVTVYETVTGAENEPHEIEADYMTIHMTPSYLIVASDFIDDYWRAFETMLGTVKGTKDRFTLDQMGVVPPEPMEDPKWNFRNTGWQIQEGISFINAAEMLNPRGIAEEIAYFRAPVFRR